MTTVQGLAMGFAATISSKSTRCLWAAQTTLFAAEPYACSMDVDSENFWTLENGRDARGLDVVVDDTPRMQVGQPLCYVLREPPSMPIPAAQHISELLTYSLACHTAPQGLRTTYSMACPTAP